MDKKKPAKKPAKKSHYALTPFLPGRSLIGPLKDMAQQLAVQSARLDGRVAQETAAALGDQLRLINSYYSNLIEGHKTTIPDIEAALQDIFSPDPEKKYAQELCRAHVQVEKNLMRKVTASSCASISGRQFLCDLHREFYASLPKDHLNTHTGKGFTDYPVKPGQLRDVNVSVDGKTVHGPDYTCLPELLTSFESGYDPSQFHGDERLVAMAVSHHRLTWLHPFRDGNGRVTRLFSGLYLAVCGVNRHNLWSLSRGLSRKKNQYMFELWATDSIDQEREHFFDEDLTADFCEFFFTICLDQIDFMEQLLRLDLIESRIDWYVESRRKQHPKSIRIEAARLLRAVFMRGAVARGEASEILNMSARSARRIVSNLLEEGLLCAKSHRAPLTIGLPVAVLPYYFPDLYEPSVFGTEHIDDETIR